jgi:phosphatidate cytidylyltransferase
MLKRTITGVVLIALIAGVLVLDWQLEKAGWPKLRPRGGAEERTMLGLPLAVLTLLLVGAGYLELTGLAAGAGMPVLRFSGIVCAVLVGTLPFWRQALTTRALDALLAPVVLGAVVMVLFADQMARYRTQDAIRRIGGTLLGICYVGVCGSVMLGIRMQFGLKAFVLFLLAVKSTDIGAYYVGTAFGRHKLIPWLSPKKTWEGLFGGVAVAAVAAAVFAAGTRMDVSWSAAAVFAAVTGLVGQGADLCESALKRDAKRKDAGRTVPGMGGVLDVLDSPLLSAPAAYLLLALLR